MTRRDPTAPCQSCGFPIIVRPAGHPVPCHTCALFAAWEAGA